MKKLHTLIVSSLLLCGFYHLPAKSSELNDFGISTIVPQKNESFAIDNLAFYNRIEQELPVDFNVQDILIFIQKIETYIDCLLDTDTKNLADIHLAQLAVIDVNKAKKMLKSNQVDKDEEHDLRLALRHVDTRAQSLINPDKTFQE